MFALIPLAGGKITAVTDSEPQGRHGEENI